MSHLRYESYKDSGVEWLGEVPGHWEVKPIKTVTSCNDEALPENTPEDYEFDYIEISDVNSSGKVINSTKHFFASAPSRARRIVRNGDIIVSTVRTYLRAIASIDDISQNTIVSTGFAVIRPKSVDHSFMGYMFRAEYLISDIIAKSVGISYPAINASELVRLKIPLPPLPEQQSIASYLDRETSRIDSLISEQNELIALLKEKRQALISHCVTKGLDPDVKMKDSGVEWLGMVPEHWEVTKLKHLVIIKTGFAFSSEAFIDEGIPVLRIGDISPNDAVDFSNGKFLPMKYKEINSGCLVISDDIVMAMTGATIGKAGWYNLPEPALLNQRVCLFRTNQLNIQRYTWYILNSSFYMEHINLTAFGGAQPNISDTEIADYYVPLPPLPEQQSIATYLDKETSKIDNLIKESESTITLMQEHRAALISAAVTGKIKVPDVVAEV